MLFLNRLGCVAIWISTCALPLIAEAKTPPQKTTNNTTSVVSSTAPVSASRKAERQYYAEAERALDKKQPALYKTILPKIRKYPLTPYLELRELGDRLLTLPKIEVDAFLRDNQDSYVAERMKHKWLRTLALKEKWQDYITYYDSNLTDPELACLNFRAHLETGDTSVLKQIDSLWNTERNLPKACDPVIDQWQAAGYMTPELLWSRHTKAVKAGEISLAVSLAQQMKSNQQAFALLYENVAQNPRLLLQHDNFDPKFKEVRSAIAYGMEKLSADDASKALELWNSYKKKIGFTDEETLQIKYTLARNLLRQDQGTEAESLVANTPNLSHPDLMEALIREALRQQDWRKAYTWVNRLPGETKNTDRWNYWQARLMQELRVKELNGKTPTDLFNQLAQTRSFYGFLAAQQLRTPYSLQDKPLDISKDILQQVEKHPGIQRAYEYYLQGDLLAASREWSFTTKRLPTTEHMVAAGRLADRWGWYQQAILTLNDADYLDELSTRFPLPYHSGVKNAAQQSSVDPHFIFAITRQESAFKIDAKSPVGAMGLMQLMPMTAKSTAKKAGLNFKPQDLTSADKNLVLGSHYLDELLSRFNGNRILAAAAYNAGPSRVKQWLNDETNRVNADVWIETIPYKETRQYVQNVLTYALIYAYRTGSPQSFMTPEEEQRKL